MILKAALKAPPEKSETVNLKLSPSEKAEILAKARKYAGGNLSLWLRLAGAMFTPAKRDLAP